MATLVGICSFRASLSLQLVPPRLAFRKLSLNGALCPKPVSLAIYHLVNCQNLSSQVKSTCGFHPMYQCGRSAILPTVASDDTAHGRMRVGLRVESVCLEPRAPSCFQLT